MSIFLFIYLPILLYAFKSYHKAFLLYAVIRPFLNHQILLIAMPGLPQIYLETFMNTFMFMCVSLNYISNKPQNSITFPLKRVFFVYTVTICISCLASNFPLYREISTIYQSILNDFIFVYLLWRELKTVKDIKFFIKGIMITSSVIIAYGFFERFNDFYNPLMLYEANLNSAIEFTGEAIMQRGGQIKSVFFHSLGCGAYMAVVLPFFCYIYIQYKEVWGVPKWSKFLFIGGLFFALLFTQGRGSILACAISLIFILKIKNMLRLSLLLPFFMIIFYDWLEPYKEVIFSIFSSDEKSSEVEGSNWTMRLMQFALSVQIWEDRPWLGYGAIGSGYWMDQKILGLNGLESIWLKTLIDYGIIGVVSQIYLYCSMIKLGIGKSKRYVVGSVLAWVVLETTTVSWGFVQYKSFLIGFLLIAYRLELLLPSFNTKLSTGKN
jgi:hypothetical protein